MDIASELCEELFSWRKQRELCRQQLVALAQKLENLREGINGCQVVANSISVAGGAALVAAGILTVYTAGAAAPFLAMVGWAGVFCSTAIDVGLKVVETWSSSSTMKTAKETIQKNEEIEQNIQRLQERLLKECGGQARRASSSDGEHKAAVCMLKAIGKQSGIQLQDGLYQNLTSGKSEVGSAVADGVATAAFTYKVLSLTIKGVMMNIGSIGLKTAAKGSAKVVANLTSQTLGGGALGLAISLTELIETCNEMVGENHVTEASQSLREAAQAIEQARQELKMKLDAIQYVPELLVFHSE